MKKLIATSMAVLLAAPAFAGGRAYEQQTSNFMGWDILPYIALRGGATYGDLNYGFNDAKFGEADTLARAKNTSVATLQSKGVFVAEKGVAHLVDRDKLPEKIDYADNTVWLFTQRLTHAMSMGDIKACATLIHNVHTSLPEQSKALAYRLHSIAERKGWQDEAFAYNSLVIAWTDIQMAAANIHESEDDQYKLDL